MDTICQRILYNTYDTICNLKTDDDYKQGVMCCAAILSNDLYYGHVTLDFLCDMKKVKERLNIDKPSEWSRLSERYKEVVKMDERELFYAWYDAWFVLKFALMFSISSEGYHSRILHEGA